VETKPVYGFAVAADFQQDFGSAPDHPAHNVDSKFGQPTHLGKLNFCAYCCRYAKTLDAVEEGSIIFDRAVGRVSV